MRVVICGGGVIGAATAYALSSRDVDVVIVERWRVGGAASGKSGGFLALDWCDGTPVEALARRSFELHAVWADMLGNPYGWRRVDTFGAAVSMRRTLGGARGSGADWLADDAVHRQPLGDRTTTAQLDPHAFTMALVDAAVANGATLRTANVAGLARSATDDRVRAVKLAAGSEIACDAAVLALGPWSPLAHEWLDMPPVYGLKGHSLVFRPAKPLPPEAIFAQIEDRDGDVLTPEIVPRANGTVYACGLSGDDPLPVDPSAVGPEPGACERLRAAVVRLVPSLADAEIIAEQACYRPITGDGLPLIGPAAQSDGAFIATGHSVWGMLNAPGTGEALAELITTGATSHVDLAPFRPDRLQAMAATDLAWT